MKKFIKINAYIYFGVAALVIIITLINFQHFKENYLFYIFGFSYSVLFGFVSLSYLKGNNNLKTTLKIFAILSLLSGLSCLIKLRSQTDILSLVIVSIGGVYNIILSYALFSVIRLRSLERQKS